MKIKTKNSASLESLIGILKKMEANELTEQETLHLLTILGLVNKLIKD